MLNRIPAAAYLLLIVAGAAVHGAVTQRWSSFAPDAGRAERVHGLVIEFGGCESELIEHDVPLKERSIATSRRYRCPDRGLAANTSIISGVPGAVATHTPDVCYTSSGYAMIAAPRRRVLELPGGQRAEYLEADFEKNKASGIERLRVRWAWSVDGTWLAPEQPRFHFIRQQELFKLYVVTTLPLDEAAEDDPPVVLEFLAAAFAQYGSALTH